MVRVGIPLAISKHSTKPTAYGITTRLGLRGKVSRYRVPFCLSETRNMRGVDDDSVDTSRIVFRQHEQRHQGVVCVVQVSLETIVTIVR